MAKSKQKPLRQQPAFKRLRELLKQTSPRDLLWYYRAGECVSKLFPSEGGRQYGQGQMAKITTALDKSENFANAMWEYRNFFAKYDRSEVKSLVSPNDGNEFHLSWTHIKHLLSVDDAERIGFQEDCINAEWSSKELHRAIKEYRGHKSAGGKPFVRPTTLDAGLRQMIYEGNTWIRRHRQVWFGDDPVISEDSEQENAKQLPELLGEAIESWKAMEWLIETYLPKLERMRTKFKKAAAPKKKRKAAKRTKAKKKAASKRKPRS